MKNNQIMETVRLCELTKLMLNIFDKIVPEDFSACGYDWDTTLEMYNELKCSAIKITKITDKLKIRLKEFND